MQPQPPTEFLSIALCATNGSMDLSNGTITDLENVTGCMYLNTALNERWPWLEDREEPHQLAVHGAAQVRSCFRLQANPEEAHQVR